MKQPLKVATREQQVREIVTCGKDPVHFMKNYAKIQHPLKGLITFDTYPFQDDCIQAFNDHRLNIVLKARQLGLSTVVAAYAAWFGIFYKDKEILVIATKLNTAINFIKKVRVIIDNLPPWLLLPQYEASRQSIRFTNGSSITAIPTSDDAGRSNALSLLIVDECAFIKNFDEIWTGLAPTITTGGRAIILSTPNGVGGTYHKLWTEAEAGVNEFNPIRLPWDVHPDHDQAWFDKETKSLSKKSIAQEHLCDFASSGDTFLSSDVLEYIRNEIRQPTTKDTGDRNIWIWNDPEPDHVYVISADVARGDGHDYSAFHVIDTDLNEVVVEYMGKIPPEKLADVLSMWGKKYNNALIVPENNTFGYFVNTKLRDNGYPRLYYTGMKCNPLIDHFIPDKEKLPGFPTVSKSRSQILTKLEEMIRTKQLKIKSQRLYDQLQSFIWAGSRPQASRDSYDDLVISLAIGAWFLEGSGGVVADQAHAMAYALLNATTVQSRDIKVLPGISPPQMTQRDARSMMNNMNPLKGTPVELAPDHLVKRLDRIGDFLDYSWLYR